MQETLVHTETDERGVEYRLLISPEDTEVRGNASASGDDEADREAEDAILAELESGNTWSWCSVRVQAKLGEFTGDDYLGCCSYRNTAEFIQQGGYWDDMKAEATVDLRGKLERASVALGSLL